MKRFLLSLIALAFLWLPTAPAQATCGDGASQCFVRTAGGNWNAGTTWATSSGGASCACTPATGDSVVIDSNSGNSTINAAFSLSSLDATGFTGTLTHNSATTLTITGNIFTLVSGMTYSPQSGSSSLLSFTSTSGTTAITTGGKSVGSITFNGVGGTFQLQDNLTTIAVSGTVTLTNGTFTANNKNVTAGIFASSNSNTRVLIMGSGTWTFNSTTGTVWDTSTATNLTVTPNTATIAFTPNSTPTGARTFATGGVATLPGVTIAGGNTGHAFTISGAATMASLGLTAPLTLRLPSSTTTTISSAYTIAGTSASNLIFLESSDSTGAGKATISVASGSATLNWAALQNITCSGGATFSAANSFDMQGNTTCNIAGPSGGGGIIGG